MVGILVGGKIKYVPKPGCAGGPPPAVASSDFGELSRAVPLLPAPVKAKRAKVPREKVDPKFLAAARELRDRWMENVNAGECVFEDEGKYDVRRVAHADARAGAKLLTWAA